VSPPDQVEECKCNEHLLLMELTHRMNNEFTSAIAILALAAACSTHDEVKGAIAEVENRLRNYVKVNRLPGKPSHETPIDASAQLRMLCESTSQSRLDCKGIELFLVGCPLRMSADRCWRLNMIVFELITNSVRHAFGDVGGRIRVELKRFGSFVRCRVEDNGMAPGELRPGRGSAIIEALTSSLDGTLKQYFGERGAVSDLIFPASPSQRVVSYPNLIDDGEHPKKGRC
jgi:two-component sensor histidine kinase